MPGIKKAWTVFTHARRMRAVIVFREGSSRKAPQRRQRAPAETGPNLRATAAPGGRNRHNPRCDPITGKPAPKAHAHQVVVRSLTRKRGRRWDAFQTSVHLARDRGPRSKAEETSAARLVDFPSVSLGEPPRDTRCGTMGHVSTSGPVSRARSSPARRRRVDIPDHGERSSRLHWTGRALESGLRMTKQALPKGGADRFGLANWQSAAARSAAGTMSRAGIQRLHAKAGA